MMLRYLLPAALFIGLVVLLGVGLTRDPRHVPSPLIGKPAPAFDLPQLQQPEQRLRGADLKGGVSVINIWASWCVSCRAEHPLLKQVAAEPGVTLYGINYKDEREDALRWLKQFGDPYRASAFDHDGRSSIDWGVYGTPETFVVDAQGIIRHKHTGPLAPESLPGFLQAVRAVRDGRSG
jgi:cytochrome c biogenesis protein CcmG/thiol:disulfide interchange protein DsbE